MEKLAAFGVPRRKYPRPQSILANATHLGLHTGEGTVQTESAIPDLGRITGQFGSGSPFVFTAANGDKLSWYYGRVDKGVSQ